MQNPQRLQGMKVAIGVGGGIAAYKVCELVRELVRRGAQVRVAMTSAGTGFVTPLSFQALSGSPVLTDALDPGQEQAFGHLALARWADVFLIAPATADLIARIRAGQANDAVTTSLLAFGGPVVLAPSMNSAMYENRQTQENLKALLADARFTQVGPGTGDLACGEVGVGRLAEAGEILEAISGKPRSRGSLTGKKVLITAGPTREHLDPVRFLSNPSTGKMGMALAHAAKDRGAGVTVVLGPVGAVDREGLEVIDVISAEEMAAEVLRRVAGVDCFIAAAAVSDFRPKIFSSKKRKKGAEGEEEEITLVRTTDVLAEVSQKRGRSAVRPVLVGFAAETHDLVKNAEEKLRTKNLDLIVANQVGEEGTGFGSDTNRVRVIGREGPAVEIEGEKRIVAEKIFDLLAARGLL